MEQSISLFELNQAIKNKINDSFDNEIWVRAEISELKINSTGHSYWELIQKDENNNNIIAKIKANCWRNTFIMLKPYFEQQTEEVLRAGLKIMIKVSVNFHEIYGMSLNITDIEPAYTIGDMAINRQKIIAQLTNDGVINMNKSLQLSPTPQRIAVISSATAAGYDDFCDQLNSNSFGFVFYTKLFPAIMQGQATEQSIINALNRINEHIDLFDVVVIIRGGGATADLSSFDSYILASYCAQFPLPIITGIGHKRDSGILDIIAHTSVKTPTAAAEFIIGIIKQSFDTIKIAGENLKLLTTNFINDTKNRLKENTNKLPYYVNSITQKHKNELNYKLKYLKQDVESTIKQQKSKLNNIIGQHISSFITNRMQWEIKSFDIKTNILVNATNKFINSKNKDIDIKEKIIELNSPYKMLKKGYSITKINNKTIKDINTIKKGDTITTILYNGEIKSTVK